MFKNEYEFETALTEKLQRFSWSEVFYNWTEKDLIENWRKILSNHNMDIDRLNGKELTDSEMNRVMDQVRSLRNPAQANQFISGQSILIQRDDGSMVSLRIFDPREIAGGDTVYQIVRQIDFGIKENNPEASAKRGDITLLFSGMPLIHVELKLAGTDAAINQIARYEKLGCFSGIFSLTQIMVAMSPDDMLYYANYPAIFENNKFHFHWTDFKNRKIHHWQQIAEEFLSIPPAHQMVATGVVADGETLKVMRPYQYHAARTIKNAAYKWYYELRNEFDPAQLGGYIWHTTGSGKTLTAFKAAQLIEADKSADKVVFVMDRTALSIQSLDNYRRFANDDQIIDDTQNSHVLRRALTNNTSNFIVTSMQKLDRLKTPIHTRIAFIIDECHRSTFGKMLAHIKRLFPNSIFFGFTGTPIYDENKKKTHTTANIFGNELHRYTITDGILDGNVLGFDPQIGSAYKSDELRQEVAFKRVNTRDLKEIFQDPKKREEYARVMAMDMVEIEKEVPISQYREKKYQNAVVDDILSTYERHSNCKSYHAIFATSSIPEAIEYYRIFKDRAKGVTVTALFDDNANDNIKGSGERELGLIEIIRDYNQNFGTNFTETTFKEMKSNILHRMQDSRHYADQRGLYSHQDKDIDILIVVNQLLTGFDSKYISMLFLDKKLEYEHIIQAFSRTNRIAGIEKTHGIIKYYRMPFTMEQEIEKAVALYSPEQKRGLFVQKLPANLKDMNSIFEMIENVFIDDQTGKPDFTQPPATDEEKARFVSLFNQFNNKLDSAKLQDFSWEHDPVWAFKGVQVVSETDQESSLLTELTSLEEEADDTVATDSGNPSFTALPAPSSEHPIEIIKLKINEFIYNQLLARYKEIAFESKRKPGKLPFDIEPSLTTIETGKIDKPYMLKQFSRYAQSLEHRDSRSKDELLNLFSLLPSRQKDAAAALLDEINEENKTFDGDFFEEINHRVEMIENRELNQIVSQTGVDLNNLKKVLIQRDEPGHKSRFNELAEHFDEAKARKAFGQSIPYWQLAGMVNEALEEFIANYKD